MVCIVVGPRAAVRAELARRGEGDAEGAGASLREWYALLVYGLGVCVVLLAAAVVGAALRQWSGFRGQVVPHGLSLPGGYLWSCVAGGAKPLWPYAPLILVPTVAYAAGAAVLLRAARLHPLLIIFTHPVWMFVPEHVLYRLTQSGVLSFSYSPVVGSPSFHDLWWRGEMPAVSTCFLASRLLVLAAGRLLALGAEWLAGSRGAAAGFLFREQLALTGALVVLGIGFARPAGLVIPQGAIKTRFPKPLRTEHFVIYGFPARGSTSPNLAEEHEWALRWLCGRLGRRPPDRRIESYVYNDVESMAFLTGWRNCHPVYGPGAVHVVAQYGQVPNLRHELVHLLLGRPPARYAPLVVEGVAEALAGRQSVRDRDLAALLRAGRLPEPGALGDSHSFWRSESRTHLAYPVAGSFSRFLLREYGLARFLSLSQEARFEEVYHRSLRDLGAAWTRYLQGFPVVWRDVRRAGYYWNTHPDGNPFANWPVTPFDHLGSEIRQALREGNWRKAMAVCDRVPSSDPEWPRAQAHRAACLRRLGRLEEARDLLDRLGGTPGPRSYVYFETARVWHELGDQFRAEMFLRQAAEENERLAIALDPFAFAARLYQRPRLRALLNEFPDDPTAWPFSEVAQRVAQLAPQFGPAFLWRSQDFRSDSSAALADARRALELGGLRPPEEVTAHMRIADLLAARGRMDAAARHYYAVIRLSGTLTHPEERWQWAENAAEKEARARWEQNEGRRYRDRLPPVTVTSEPDGA